MKDMTCFCVYDGEKEEKERIFKNIQENET